MISTVAVFILVGALSVQSCRNSCGRCSCVATSNPSGGLSTSSGRCEAGWDYRDEKCYKVFFPASAQESALTKGLCKADGANAVSISSQADNDWVTDYALKAVQGAGKYPSISWIILGAHLEADNSLSWDGSSSGASCPFNYTNWGPTEPRGDGGTIHLNLNDASSAWGAGQKGKWNDIWDTYKANYPTVCVKAAIGAPPNSASCDYKPPPTNNCSSCCSCKCCQFKRCGC